MKQYFHRLFNELLRHDHDNTYVFFYFHHNIEELDQLHSDRWKSNAVFLNNQDEVNQHLDKIDLYFCPFGALWPRSVKVPSVVMLPDIQEKYFPEFFTKNDLFDREYYYDPSTHIADQVITISNYTKDSVVKYHRISPAKIHVAYLCADQTFYDDSCDETLSVSLALPENYIFYPANQWLHKNHDNLLKALAILKDCHGLAINSVFSGHGAQNGYALALKVKEYGLQDQVKILGFLTTAELKLVYTKATLLCFPSLFEGFGMPVLEAMALGCPVVCSNTTSLPEVAGDAVLYFDPVSPDDIADKIRMLWDNKELKDDLVARGRKRSLLFSARAMAEKHLIVFQAAKASYSRTRYYYHALVYDPIYRLKMKYKKIKYQING